ncbi:MULTISPECIES: phosphate ABC transporter permease PstA [Acidobacterium]|uniref:Phosphate transport system permease protein PstA n=1 Tax=Acidobacterium capsulatum (strain ATCC 51196 / DSM 11244 / BCRC 80197 / JCM 7670 / NBRC 15755 / NCIMB 13165 / 161) TaxID=240015 RepID=C1F206_ACIC5|nr:MULTISPECIES: phosphate ABC transporter permease PstA [Acidobacterium]ACO32506.1 phosphate ABC transporter, permease protein PstA [Acidobacterium capsulatum ATCC 51196]
MAVTAADVRSVIMKPSPLRATQRAVFNFLGWGLCAFTFAVLGFAMIWILKMVFVQGASSMNWKVLSTVTTGVGGGLLNAIEGTLLLALGGVVLSVPPGIAAGIYLSEYDGGWLAPVLRFMSDVLVGVPSIVVGYFCYVTMVDQLGWKFSIAAGSISLAIISMPYVTRTAEVAFRAVPRTLREAGFGLGCTPGTVILRVCLPMALPTILTGVLLALAISVGETAPLIYTAGWSSYMWTGHLTNEPVGYLTYVIWTFITEPFASAHALAFAAAFFVTVFVLIISVIARVVTFRRSGWGHH